eukprot:4229197-Lingulodinium_polyedra.AAC.1
MIVGVPWKRSDEDDGGDGEDLRGGVRIMDKEYRERMEEKDEHVPVPRRIHIRQQDLEKFGYSVRCPGCVS